MKEELDNNLVKKFPKIFRDRYADMKTTCMCWGFDCLDGWYHLIYNLCESIQSYIDNNEHLKIPQVYAVQIKEKLGGLRFYVDGGNEKIGGMIWLAEHLSYDICEECGSTKNVGQTSSWIYTVCKKCAKKLDYTNWKENKK